MKLILTQESEPMDQHHKKKYFRGIKKYSFTQIFQSVVSPLGFSLMEMMVVLAITSIMVIIAIPTYNSFVAKSRQKEGFHLLSTYYAAAQSTFAEYGNYPGNFVQTGFQPNGNLGYRLRAANAFDIGLPFNDTACFSTQADCDCSGLCPEFKIWQEAPVGIIGSRTGPAGVSPTFDVCPPLANLSVNSAPGNYNFSVRVAGVINASSTKVDAYGMDQTKRLVMCQDGLN